MANHLKVQKAFCIHVYKYAVLSMISRNILPLLAATVRNCAMVSSTAEGRQHVNEWPVRCLCVDGQFFWWFVQVPVFFSLKAYFVRCFFSETNNFHVLHVLHPLSSIFSIHGLFKRHCKHFAINLPPIVFVQAPELNQDGVFRNGPPIQLNWRFIWMMLVLYYAVDEYDGH